MILLLGTLASTRMSIYILFAHKMYCTHKNRISYSCNYLNLYVITYCYHIGTPIILNRIVGFPYVLCVCACAGAHVNATLSTSYSNFSLSSLLPILAF